MTDEQFTAWLHEHVGEYNAPPTVPTELMWSRLADDVERIVGGHAAAPAVRAAPVAQRASAEWPWRRHAMPTAAGLLFTAAVVVGIVIGRLGVVTRSGTAMPPRVASGVPTGHAAAAPEPPRIVAEPTPDLGAAGEATSHRGRTPAREGEGTRWSPRRTGAPLPRLPRFGAPSAPPSEARDPGSVYAMTRDLHLAESEALLSAFRTDVKAKRVDPALARMARDLLARTRVLYDAPATGDPRVKALLADLELILIQLSSYRPDRRADLKMAAQAIDDSGLLPRLREAKSL